VDGGVNVPHDETKIVRERTKGEHIAEYAKSLGPENYGNKFSKYSTKEISPEKLPEHFAKVKTDIVGSFKTGGKKKA
jgi:large subunit ribosomal protein L18